MVLIEFSDGSLYQFDAEFLYEQRDKRLPAAKEDSE
jgi:hypothetical protein